jgi:hypothetical protein
VFTADMHLEQIPSMVYIGCHPIAMVILPEDFFFFNQIYLMWHSITVHALPPVEIQEELLT